MSAITETRKCGRCMALENALKEFDLSEVEVMRLKAGQTVTISIDFPLYERIRSLLDA